MMRKKMTSRINNYDIHAPPPPLPSLPLFFHRVIRLARNTLKSVLRMKFNVHANGGSHFGLHFHVNFLLKFSPRYIRTF